MSSISSVSPVTNPCQTNYQAGYGQMVQNFDAVGSALQSGDLATAQSALTTFQQALPASSASPASQPFGKNSQANTDYQSLTSSLQSGNLGSAQKAFSSLQKDLQPAQSTHAAHKGHHHHHSSSATTEAAAATTASSTVSSTTNSHSDSAVGSNGSLNTFA